MTYLQLHIKSNDSEPNFSAPMSIKLKSHPKRRMQVFLTNKEMADGSSKSQQPAKFLKSFVCTGEKGSGLHFVCGLFVYKNCSNKN